MYLHTYVVLVFIAIMCIGSLAYSVECLLNDNRTEGTLVFLFTIFCVYATYASIQ